MRQILNTYTRKIDKEYNRLLFKQAIVNSDKEWNQSFNINPSDIQDAKDYLMIAMYWFSNNELDNLWIKEYTELLWTLDKHIESEKNGSIWWNIEKVSKSN